MNTSIAAAEFAERLASVPDEHRAVYLIGGLEAVLGRERLSDAERVAEIRTYLAIYERGQS